MNWIFDLFFGPGDCDDGRYDAQIIENLRAERKLVKLSMENTSHVSDGALRALLKRHQDK